MMRSLSSAVAGLRTHQTKMDVIGNNIANVNTYGFKSSRATFADVYYQNLTGARAGVTGSEGGSNPTQIGYGASVATVDMMMQQAGSATTDRAMDVYITGDGFLVSKDATGKTLYTRLGILGFDAAGNLIDSGGNLVQGFPMGSDGNPIISSNGTIEGDAVQGIWVDPEILEVLTSISISSNGTITGLMPGDTELNGLSTNPDWLVNDLISIPETSTYRGPVRLAVSGFCSEADMATALGITGGTVDKIEMGTLALPEGEWDVEIDNNGKVTISIVPTNGEDSMTLSGYVDKNGVLTLKNSKGSVGLTVTMSSGATLPTPVAPATTVTSTLQLDLYYQMTTSDKGGNTITEPSTPQLWTGADGTVKLGEVTITVDGFDDKAFNNNIGTAKASDGEPIVLGCLVLAKFSNASGLQQAGTSYFTETANSGTAVYTRPGLEGTGELSAGYLEMSNVDLSNEFTSMITTQRGFQANSRIITVSDEMLQELVNLKR